MRRYLQVEIYLARAVVVAAGQRHAEGHEPVFPVGGCARGVGVPLQGHEGADAEHGDTPVKLSRFESRCLVFVQRVGNSASRWSSEGVCRRKGTDGCHLRLRAGCGWTGRTARGVRHGDSRGWRCCCSDGREDRVDGGFGNYTSTNYSCGCRARRGRTRRSGTGCGRSGRSLSKSSRYNSRQGYLLVHDSAVNQCPIGVETLKYAVRGGIDECTYILSVLASRPHATLAVQGQLA
ncbi:hypothetical protein F4779DRAFT_578851 [Xylariaceae sp. FL0662B]|nr:hypothetical protein F4779DRAFT_578851 [Xylariaceae sp. FL0662B]